MSVASLFIQPTSFQTVVDNYIMFRRLFIRIIRLILVQFVCDNKQHFYFFIISLFLYFFQNFVISNNFDIKDTFTFFEDKNWIQSKYNE